MAFCGKYLPFRYKFKLVMLFQKLLSAGGVFIFVYSARAVYQSSSFSDIRSSRF